MSYEERKQRRKRCKFCKQLFERDIFKKHIDTVHQQELISESINEELEWNKFQKKLETIQKEDNLDYTYFTNLV